MHYLLIDTNVYFNFKFAREKNVAKNAPIVIKDCLQNEEVKLIIPEVVKNEVEMKIYDQYQKTKEQLSHVLKGIKKWQYPYIKGEVIERKQKEIEKNIKLLLKKLEEKKEEIIDTEWFEYLLESPNSYVIKLGDDDVIEIIRRFILSEYPFLKSGKPYRDAFISMIASCPKKYIEGFDAKKDMLYLFSTDSIFQGTKTGELNDSLKIESEKNGTKLVLRNYLSSTLRKDLGIEIDDKTIEEEEKIVRRGSWIEQYQRNIQEFRDRLIYMDQFEKLQEQLQEVGKSLMSRDPFENLSRVLFEIVESQRFATRGLEFPLGSKTWVKELELFPKNFEGNEEEDEFNDDDNSEKNNKDKK